jgi:hypothetical protein
MDSSKSKLSYIIYSYLLRIIRSQKLIYINVKEGFAFESNEPILHIIYKHYTNGKTIDFD